MDFSDLTQTISDLTHRHERINMREEWRIIDMAPRYLISNKGRVKKKHDGKFLKINMSGDYPRVNLHSDDVYFSKSTHILVATAFVDGKRPGFLVNHKDGNKFNPIYTNLEWVTHKENMEHAIKTGLTKRRKLRKWVLLSNGKWKEIER